MECCVILKSFSAKRAAIVRAMGAVMTRNITKPLETSCTCAAIGMLFIKDPLGLRGLLRQHVSRSSGRYCERHAYADCTARFRLISKHPASPLQIVVTSGDHGHRNHRRTSRALALHIRIHWTHSSLGISYNAGRKWTDKIQRSSASFVVHSYVCFRNCHCCPF
jgi:hypothetical protein